jgi:hypothetical protein
MDKKDLLAFFQELRLFYGQQKWSEKLPEIEKIFENTNINKLDIKRIYRYLDKNVKNEVSVIYDEIEDDDDEII